MLHPGSFHLKCGKMKRGDSLLLWVELGDLQFGGVAFCIGILNCRLPIGPMRLWTRRGITSAVATSGRGLLLRGNDGS
jgi:hypothetical protein